MPKKYEYHITDFYIPYNNELFAIYSTDMQNYEISELYQIKRGTNMIKQFYGSWSGKSGLTANKRSFELRRKNFENVSLTLATETEVRKYTSLLLQEQYYKISLLFQKLPCSYRMECYQREVWDDFSKILNFT